jgi:hypothetical protein
MLRVTCAPTKKRKTTEKLIAPTNRRLRGDAANKNSDPCADVRPPPSPPAAENKQ